MTAAAADGALPSAAQSVDHIAAISDAVPEYEAAPNGLFPASIAIAICSIPAATNHRTEVLPGRTAPSSEPLPAKTHVVTACVSARSSASTDVDPGRTCASTRFVPGAHAENPWAT